MEWRLAGEHLVDDAGEAVDVACRAEIGLPARLLGTHVLRRTDRESDFRRHRAVVVRFLLGVAAGARYAEVREQRVPIGEENVLRLHVAMHEPLAVREIETGADFLRDAQRVFQRQLPRLGQTLAQRSSRDVGLHVIEQSSGFARVDQRDDVRVSQLGSNADLAQKTIGAEAGRDFGSQDFDRDLSPVLLFFGEVHRRHSAAPQLPLDGIAVGECSGDWWDRLRITHEAKS